MFFNKNILIRLLLFGLVLTGITAVSGLYVPTARDTKEPPEAVTEFITEPTELELLTETEDFRYYFRDSRDTLFIHDKRNGYTWQTGTDLEYAKDIDDECDDVLDLYEEQFVNVPVDTFGAFTTTLNSDNSTIDVLLGSVKVKVEDLIDTSLENDVALSLSGLTLTQTKLYRVTFTASANQAKTVKVVIGSYSEEILLTTTETTYTIDLPAILVTNNDASLSFLFGNVSTDFTNTSVSLDDVMLEEFDGTDIIADTNQVLRGDFELTDAELTTKEADVLAACRPKEVRLNTTYTGFANSLITIEYYDISNNIKRVSSAAHVSVDSDLKKVGSGDDHYQLEIDFKKLDIEVIVHIYLDNEGVRYEVKDTEITGDGTDVLAAVIVSPFLGASGGAYEVFDMAELDYADQELFKPRTPGYSFVPDGSGTLIRFNDNDVKLEPYKGQIYGIDEATEELHYDNLQNFVAFKEPSMPVFGITHGFEQAAFVAYATVGEEYMEIIAMPDENLTYYNFTYPRFEYNKQYLQVYNKSGWGYLTLYEERNHFDIEMRYDFLSGTDADYVGMAKQYREYLLDNDLLTLIDPDYDEIPLRLDFFMSDVEEGVTGYNNMVTTTPSGVDRILAQVKELGINNINSGLLGWNDGGVTKGSPNKTKFTGEIGRKGEFEDLIAKYQAEGIDISFSDDYYLINEEMMSLRNNAAQHTNTWYAVLGTYHDPISEFFYARPVRSIEWMLEQAKDFNKLGVSSYSISGISNNLISDYTDDTSRTEAKQIIMDGYAALDQDMLVNNYQPNSYLWQFTDRYLGSDVYGTQYLIETDTVPFLQIVLQGTMELYGPYSNFSFYTDSDVLRMIDYNIYPSFVLTEEPAYLLMDTNSKNFYSTEYSLYSELIDSIYQRVNNALSPVIGAAWENRTVLENGVIKNTYSNGVDIIINYTEDSVTYDGVTVGPESYEVVGE